MMPATIEINLPRLLIAADNHSRELPVLRRNSQGEAVRRVQEFLDIIGYHPRSINGYFSFETEELVRAFQNHSGLHSNGVVDEITWNALSIASRKFQS
ncbi:MAG: peptidoglycan-binding protein [Xenococcaceae cyanobacterium]